MSTRAPIFARAALLLTITTLITHPATAQTNIKINSRNVAAYADLLALEPEQRDVAQALFELYMLDMESAERARRVANEQIIADARAAQSREGMKERMLEATHEYEARAASVERAFFGDIRVTLTPEQEERWPKVKRLRRRETILRTGWLSGENIDLIALTRSVGGQRDLGPDVHAALENYELQLDRALVKKDREMRKMREVWEDPKGVSERELAELGETKANVGVPVRDLNRRHARLIEALMPDDLKGAFRDEMLRRSYPRVYRESHVDRILHAAQRFDDLTNEQRASINEFDATYTRERKAADAAWSSAIADREDLRGQTSKTPEPPVELARARETRHELDTRIQRRIEGVLTPEQRRRLPRVEEEKAEKK